STLDGRLRNQFPQYVELAGAQPVSIPDVQRLLAVDEALVAWVFNAEGNNFLFVVRKNSVGFAATPGTAADISRIIDRLRSGLEPPGGVLNPDTLPGFDTAEAYEL